MRIGVVGLGFMGSTHLQAYEKIERAELAAVASSDPKKLAGDLSGIGGNLDVQGAKLDFGNAQALRNVRRTFRRPRRRGGGPLPSYVPARTGGQRGAQRGENTFWSRSPWRSAAKSARA